MKTLVVEDEFTAREILRYLLAPYGRCDVTENGKEGLSAFEEALKSGEGYDLVCLDILMPEMDGGTVLKEMRRIEEAEGVQADDLAKIIMITIIDDPRTVMASFKNKCEAYLIKPISRKKLLEQLKILHLVEEPAP